MRLIRSRVYEEYQRQREEAARLARLEEMRKREEEERRRREEEERLEAERRRIEENKSMIASELGHSLGYDEFVFPLARCNSTGRSSTMYHLL